MVGFNQIFLIISCLFITCYTNEVINNEIRFDRFDGMCREHKNVAMTVNITNVKQIGTQLSISGVITVKTNVQNPSTMVVNILKCQSKDNPDTCEKFFTSGLKDHTFCKYLDDNHVWGTFVRNMTPPLKCPYKKGVYRINDGIFDISSILSLASGYFWKVKIDVFDDAKSHVDVLCLRMDTQIIKRKS